MIISENYQMKKEKGTVVIGYSRDEAHRGRQGWVGEIVSPGGPPLFSQGASVKLIISYHDKM